MRSLRERLDKLTNSEGPVWELVIYQFGRGNENSSDSNTGIVIYLPDNHREEPARKN